MVLIVGFFISCSASQFSVDNLIEEENYQQALVEVETEIMKNPSAELYFLKAELHGNIAMQKSPMERVPDYQSMLAAVDSSKSYVIDRNPADSLVNSYWEFEQNAGLNTYQNENDSSLTLAVAHFENAITLLPENTGSYKSLSIAQYNNRNIDGAIKTLEAVNTDHNQDTEVYESLGFLYLEKGDADKAITNYRKANQDPIKNKNIAFGLVNAYISQNNVTESLSFLEKLVEEYPNDGRLHNVYGTQLYKQVSMLFPQLQRAYQQNDTTSASNLKIEVIGVSEKAENELVEAYKIDSSNLEFVESLAVFYNNMSGNYFSVLDDTFESDKQEIRNKALSLTDFAITYYSKLLESDPQNENYNNKLTNLNKLKESWANL